MFLFCICLGKYEFLNFYIYQKKIHKFYKSKYRPKHQNHVQYRPIHVSILFSTFLKSTGTSLMTDLVYFPIRLIPVQY